MEVLNLSKVKILIDTSKFWLEIWFLPRTLFSIDLQINIFTVHISLTVLGFGFEFIFTPIGKVWVGPYDSIE